MSLFWVVASYFKARQALQWWFCRQTMQMSLEAEKIRDGLLQESFTIRRSLELSLVDNVALSANKSEDWLKKMDQLHYTLAQLSNRLSPAYIEDSLPLALESVLEPWRTCNPNLNFKICMPADWRHEPRDRSFFIVRSLEELLRILVPEFLSEISVYISLKQQENLAELMVEITYPDVFTLDSYYGRQDLEYLRESFQILTSGQCFRRRKDLTLTWYFRW